MLRFQRLCCLVLLIFGGGPVVYAELTPQQRLAVKRVEDAVAQAGRSYQAGQYEQCGQQIREAIQRIGTAMEIADREVYEKLAPSFGRIIRASALLELEGVRVPPFKRPAMPTPKSQTPPTETSGDDEPAEQPMTPDGDSGGGVSFASDVAPILVQQCGRCHINDAKGRFSLASFAELMQGPPEGVVVFAGDTVGSRLIETIETGDMPRGGTMPPDQFQVLKDWIKQGAKFDGPSPQAPLTSYARGGTEDAPARPSPQLQTQRATGEETVSFALDVAPLLVANCNGCHIDAMQVRGGLRMDTFAQLLRGGDSDAIIQPGNGDESLLVQKLRGQAGDIMPAGGRPPLADEEIQLISTWIDEGAKLDGNSEDQPLRTMAGLAWARSATHQELAERRKELAADNWKLGATPAARKNTVTAESDHFFVVGNTSPQTLDIVLESAQQALEKVRTILPARSDAPLFKGRVTLFVLPRRYDYSEFAKMVERRSIPSAWQEHWRYDGIDAYAAVVVTTQDTEAELEARLLAPLTSLAIVMQGQAVPRWFAEGIGRAAAAKLGDGDNPQVEAWRERLPEAVAAMDKPDAFLKGRLTPEDADLVAFGIGTQMLGRTSRRQFDQLMRALLEDASFEEAFERAFRGAPQGYVDAWLQYQGNAGSRRRR